MIEESLNKSEIDGLLSKASEANPTLCPLPINDRRYGFTPETAIDLRRIDSPIESLLNYANEYLDSAGIEFIKSDGNDPNSKLYKSDFYHRPSRKKFTLYFLADPEKLEIPF